MSTSQTVNIWSLGVGGKVLVPNTDIGELPKPILIQLHVYGELLQLTTAILASIKIIMCWKKRN